MRLIERDDLQVQPAMHVLSVHVVNQPEVTALYFDVEGDIAVPFPCGVRLDLSHDALDGHTWLEDVKARRKVHAVEDIAVDAAVVSNDARLRGRRTPACRSEGRLKEVIGQAPLILLEDEKGDICQGDLMSLERDEQCEPELR